jgi:hypothetical protein
MALNWGKFKSAQFRYVTSNRKPCSNPNYHNQCALRVCNALVDAGWPFNSQSQPYVASRFGPLCEHGHARGARSLADYLEVYLTPPKKYLVPINPKTKVTTEIIAGVYDPKPDSGGKFTFYKTMAWLERRANAGEKLRGIVYFNSPEHIDGFDLTDSANTKGPYGIIGEQYGDSSTEVRVFFV